MPSDFPIVELRQYTLLGGRRDPLIELFEREFVESQDAVGAQVFGRYRDLDDPDRFVWLRAFRDVATRQDALTRFYSGPVWQTHREAANTTMIDSDNVLLLRMARGGLPGPADTGIVRASIHHLGAVDAAAFLAFFDRAMAPRIAAAGGTVEAVLTSLEEPNNFPRLPVREGERVLIWIARFPDREGEAAFARRLSAQSGWRDAAPAEVLPALMRKPEILRLETVVR